MTPCSRPVMVYDGDCSFCRRWIERWRSMTGQAVDYAPYQEAAAAFPQIPVEQFRTAVQLIEPTGKVYSGAEAVFQTLRYVPGKRWLAAAYDLMPGFAAVSEGWYRFVAGHRRSMDLLTTLLWGRDVRRPTYVHSSRLFLRALGAVYLIAFLSLWFQLPGLYGPNGILPVPRFLEAVRQHLGEACYWRLPSLCWLGGGDTFLQVLCIGGAILSVGLVLGVTPGPIALLLWLFYLSLVNVGQDFLSFQWDMLLLETGFLAMLVAPWRWVLKKSSAISSSHFWLVRWLLFRLMFLSGITKLTYHDATWLNLSALNFHYETQPLPTWLGWYAHQLPAWFQAASCLIMYVIELGAPFLIFGPRRLRHLAFMVLVCFQLLIAATGNYGFFNLLTLVLCISLLDDALIRRLTPYRLRTPRPGGTEERSHGWSPDPESSGSGRNPWSHSQDSMPASPQASRRGDPEGRAEKTQTESASLTRSTYLAPQTRPRTGKRLIIATLVLIILAASLLEGWEEMRGPNSLPQWAVSGLSWVRPLHSINGYGLFRVMTTKRPEVVIEGSNDGREWREYEFRWKAGDVSRPPGFNAPHQPRLDWQMWFAALSGPERQRWILSFAQRLLEGSPSVRALLEKDPFPDGPPRYIRAMLYQYHFTDWNEHRATGAWWRRERMGLFFPPHSLPR